MKMKLWLILLVAAVLLAGIDARKRKGKRKSHSKSDSESSDDSDDSIQHFNLANFNPSNFVDPDSEFHPYRCDKTLSQIIGIGPHHDLFNLSGVFACYEENDYAYCNPDVSIEQSEILLQRCEGKLRAFIANISHVIGRRVNEQKLHDVFHPHDRQVRQTLPSACNNFALSVVSFISSIASRLPMIISEVARCISGGSGGLIACLADVLIFLIAPFFRNDFLQCLFSLLRF